MGRWRCRGSPCHRGQRHRPPGQPAGRGWGQGRPHGPSACPHAAGRRCAGWGPPALTPPPSCSPGWDPVYLHNMLLLHEVKYTGRQQGKGNSFAADFEVSRQKHFGWMLFDDLIMYWHLRSNVDTAGAMQVGKDLQQKGVRSGSGP